MKHQTPVNNDLPDGAPNYLTEKHNRLNQSVIEFREIVCQKNDWSMPTYYRKMRGGKLSEAEVMMIRRVYKSLLNSLQQTE